MLCSVPSTSLRGNHFHKSGLWDSCPRVKPKADARCRQGNAAAGGHAHTRPQASLRLLQTSRRGRGACSGLKKEPAPPQGKENSRQSQPRTRVVTSASVSATSAPALTCSRARLPAVAALPPSPCLAPLPFPRPLLSQGPGSTLRHPEPPQGLRRAERYCYSRDDSGGANVPRPGPAPHAPHLPVLTATL